MERVRNIEARQTDIAGPETVSYRDRDPGWSERKEDMKDKVNERWTYKMTKNKISETQMVRN
jgi:hypothetical protein